MSKQTENYIGSQQHWEDRINDDYDYIKQMEKKMEKDVEKLIYNGLEKRNKMSKQTAVEWVLQKILLENGIVNSDIEQALKMEKEQHEMTFNEAQNEHSSRSFEKYYDETFEISFFIWR